MKRDSTFRLIMISAMYENGGNTLHRHLDGHPELFVYPFESQLGTSLVSDYLTSLFPQKYRWPEFGISGDVAADYEAIIDEEFKVRVNTPHVSKFRDATNLGCTNADRKKIFLQLLRNKKRTRAAIIEAFFQATFLAWKTRHGAAKETRYVGYSPIVVVDADKILHDFPDAIILHIIRNPFAAYAETKRRPVPYALSRYVRTWNVVQLSALSFRALYPKQVRILRYEDLVKDKPGFFRGLAKALGIPYAEIMTVPSWNGRPLPHQYPWGTIEVPTQRTNVMTARELSADETHEIAKACQTVNTLFGYDKP